MRKSVSTLEDYEKCGQYKLLKYLETLKPEDQEKLTEKLLSIDIKHVKQIYQNCRVKKANQSQIQPIQKVLKIKDMKEDQVKKYFDVGLKTISEGKVCIAMMAGGQGTRLGFNKAKGMYDIGLPSHKSLFEIFCDRVIGLQNLVNQTVGKCLPLQLFIMTSDVNHEEVTQFFADNNYFGLFHDQITFFQQDSLPILSQEGELILNSSTTILEGPDGNGAIFTSLYNQGYLDYMKCLGIELIHICPVDNVLCKLADPLWVGYVKVENLIIGSKYVKKTNPSEKVGIHALINGKPGQREYSEMTPEDLEKRNEKGELVFDAGGIAQMICTVDFAQQFLTDPMTRDALAGNYHVADKKYEYFDLETKKIVKPQQINSLKFELFYFDCYPLCPSDQFGIIEAIREEEFAPVKNAPGEKTDTPQTACSLYMARCKKWLQKYGYNNPSLEVEICEKLSYDGSGLGHILKSYNNKFPYFITSEKKPSTTQNSRLSQEDPHYQSQQQQQQQLGHHQQQSSQHYFPKQQMQQSYDFQRQPPKFHKAQTQLKFVNRSAFPTNYQVPLSQHSSHIPIKQNQLFFTQIPNYHPPQKMSPRQTVLYSPVQDQRMIRGQNSPGRFTQYGLKPRATTQVPRPTIFSSPRNQLIPPQSLIQSVQYPQQVQSVQFIPMNQSLGQVVKRY